MQAFATWKGRFEFRVEDGRAHDVEVDLPVDLGGRSAGPTPVDLSLLALAGSIATKFAELAETHHLTYYGLHLALEAEPGQRNGPFERVHGTLRLRARAEFAEVSQVLRAALATCGVGMIFRRAQIPVEVSAVIVPPQSPETAAATTDSGVGELRG